MHNQHIHCCTSLYVFYISWSSNWINIPQYKYCSCSINSCKIINKPVKPLKRREYKTRLVGSQVLHVLPALSSPSSLSKYAGRYEPSVPVLLSQSVTVLPECGVRSNAGFGCVSILPSSDVYL